MPYSSVVGLERTAMYQQQPARSPKCFGNSTAKVLSITQVVCGGLAIVLGVVIIVIGTGSSYTGYPIWIGPLIIPFMVLSILSAVLTSVMLGFAAAAVDYDQWRWCWEIQSYCDNTRSALLIVLALLEAGLSITTAVMTCFAVCPCCKAGGSDNCCSCDNQSYQQPPAVAYQVGADGRLVQMPGQYAIQGGQPIAMTPFPASQSQHVTALPAGAMAQQPLLVTQTPANMAAAQGNVGAGQGPKPQGNVVLVPAGQQAQGGAPVQPAHAQMIGALPTVGHGGNIQYVFATSTPIPMPHAASQQQPRAQSVPVSQVQFQQPNAPQAGSSPYPVQPQPQQQPTVPQHETSAQPLAASPPPGYQPTDPGAPGVNQAFQAQDDDDVPLIDE
ncbi:Hypp1436 [Branchiostoma lanceolatum]|uniref:Hypp1436 protein n=1 Tax=Branchiostoma lanceolatum TaxID=7740 RepID=A0A8K0EKX1_BRALA|nr:Hypp1436 [Branchiostoma lanceolatum]